MNSCFFIGQNTGFTVAYVTENKCDMLGNNRIDKMFLLRDIPGIDF